MIIFSCGDPLDMIMSIALENPKKFEAWGQDVHGLCQAPLLQLLENLTEPRADDDPCVLTRKYMEDTGWLDKAKIADDDRRILLFWFHNISIAI